MAWGDNISGYTEGGGAARGSTTRSTQIFIPEL